MNLNEKLDYYLEQKSMTRAEIIQKTGLGKSTVYNLKENTSIKTIKAIADELNISIDELTADKPQGKLTTIFKKIKQLSTEEQEKIYFLLEATILGMESKKAVKNPKKAQI